LAPEVKLIGGAEFISLNNENMELGHIVLLLLDFLFDLHFGVHMGIDVM